MLASGSEHGSVIKYLEKERKKTRLESRSIDYIETKDDDTSVGDFSDLVPGLSDVSERRSRRLRAHQVDPEDSEAVEEMMQLAEDETVSWEEE